MGAVATFWPTLSSGFHLEQYDVGDTRFNAAMVEHCWQWLRHPFTVALWSPPMFSPATNTAAYSDLMLSAVALYGPWRLFGAPPDLAFQLWQLSASAATFGLAVWMLRRYLRVGPIASALGALLFTFGSPAVAQLGHPQLWLRVPAMLTLALAIEVLGDLPESMQRRWTIAAVGVLGFVGQLYESVYLAVFVAMLVPIAVGWCLALPSTRARALAGIRAFAVPVGVCGIAGALLLLPWVRHYGAAAKQLGLRPYDAVEEGLPRFQSWFFMGPHSIPYGWTAGFRVFRSLPLAWEHWIGLGAVTTVLMIWVLIRERRVPGIAVMALTALTVVLLTSEYRGGHSPWYFIYRLVPGVGAIRVTARIGLLMLIPAASALVLAVEKLRHSQPLLGAALAILCLGEQARLQPAFDRDDTRARVAALTSQVAPQCRAFYAARRVRPDEDARFVWQLDAMEASQRLGVPTINGYSGNVPPGWEALDDNQLRTPADETRLRLALAGWAERSGLDPSAVCFIQY